MKQKNKGRKIYKTKEKNYYGKSIGGKIFSACLTLLLLGGIGFLGYSAAGPVFHLDKKQGDEPIEITAPTEPETTAPAKTTNDTKKAAVSEPDFENYKAVSLSVIDIISEETLTSAIKRIPVNEEIEFIEVPLKVSGGGIYFNTQNEDAVLSGAVESRMELDDIVKTIENAGYRPAALISTFNDNMLPKYIPESGFKNAELGIPWLDNPDELLGKPCTTPFSGTAVEYNSFIVNEAASSGFDLVICSDLTFPDFTQKELMVMDQRLGVAHERENILSSALKKYKNTAEKYSVKAIAEISAADILREHSDIFNSGSFPENTIIVNIDTDKIKNSVASDSTVYEFNGSPADMTRKMLGFINERLSGINVIIRISGESSDISELRKAKDEAAGFGYSSFVIG